MDSRLSFRLSNCSSVTVFTYHPLRREIITGHDDGAIKCWQIDSGKLVLTLNEHKGLITDIIFWAGGRSLFTSSVDGTLVQWTPGFVINKEMNIGRAIHSLCWYSYTDVLLVGLNNTFGVIQLTGNTTSLGHPYLANSVHSILQGHSDIVKCMATSANKIYTAGYDKRLCIFELAHHHDDGQDPRKKQIFNLIFEKQNAHSAGITCLKLGKGTKGSLWVFTGSFDRQLKIWSSDGKFINSIQFIDTVTGIGFIPETGILWVAAGTNTVSHFEPKSGDNISGFLDHSTHSLSIPRNHYSNSLDCKLQHLQYIPETNDIIGIKNTKEVVISRYNKSSGLCIQTHSDPLGCLAYTKTRPILIFTGTAGGEMIKWERFQLNPFMYSKETLLYKEDLKRHLNTETGSTNLSYFIHGSDNVNQELGDEDSEIAKHEIMKIEHREFVKAIFVEQFDLLIASARDGKIFVWSFDKVAAKVLSEMSNPSTSEGGHTENKISEEDVITYNRVAGLIVQHILNGHSGPVQALTLVNGSKKTKATCLLSGGWDLSICIWDIESGKLFAEKKNCIPDQDQCDDLLITDIAYSNTNDIIAFSSSNHKIYLMNFSISSKEINHMTTLQGHTDEVTQIYWNPCTGMWVSGSIDGRLCIWSADGSECVKTSSTHGPVVMLSIDETHNLIVAVVKETVKVYNEQLDLVQVSQGHKDAINDLIIIPELDQYVTAGLDGTLRIWNAYTPKQNNTSLT